MAAFLFDPDIASLASVALNISECSDRAPDDLKVLLKKFADLGSQLTILNNVVLSSGWNYYNKNVDLATLLRDVQLLCAKHNLLEPNKTVTVSANEKTVGPKIDEDEIQRIENLLDEHMTALGRCCLETTYLASIKNLEDCRTTFQRKITAAREERKRLNIINVISEATTALQFAFKLKQTIIASIPPNLDTMITSSPELIALPSSTDRDLIDDFTIQSEELMERIQLYDRTAIPSEHIQDLEEFVGRANRLTKDLLPSKAGMSAEVRRLQLPTIEPSPNSLSDSFLSNYEFQKWASTSSEISSLALSARDQSLRSTNQAARSLTRSTSTQTNSEGVFSMRSIPLSEGAIEVGGPAKEHIDLVGWVKIYAGKQTDSQRISCRLDITRSEGSTCIWAVATHRRRKSSNIDIPVAMTPGMLMRGEAMSIATESDGPFRTFQHSFTNVNRPHPYVLHPSVEGPEVGEHYSIIFHDPQYFVEEGCPPKFTKELKYVFANRADRDAVRAKIFGKRLVQSVGTEKITFNYIACLQRALTLWEDEITRIRTITFYRDAPTNKSLPSGDVEYRILGITDLKKAEKDGEPLPLNVEQINQHAPASVSQPNRRGVGLANIKAIKPRTREDMSCLIYFSEVAEKRSFVNFLRQRPTM